MKNNTFIDKECYFIDKVTHTKKFDGKNLGKCVSESIHSTNSLPILWFDKPFLGFIWQYKTDVRL